MNFKPESDADRCAVLATDLFINDRTAANYQQHLFSVAVAASLILGAPDVLKRSVVPQAELDRFHVNRRRVLAQLSAADGAWLAHMEALVKSHLASGGFVNGNDAVWGDRLRTLGLEQSDLLREALVCALVSLMLPDLLRAEEKR